MNELSLLFGDTCRINNVISIRQPTFAELKNYDDVKYLNMVKTLCSTPADCMVLLDDISLDFEQISDFDLFVMLSQSFSVDDTRILFGDDLDFSTLKLKFDDEIQENVLYGITNKGQLIKIDSYTYMLIVDFLRECHGLTPNRTRAGNEFTKRWMIDDQREEIERNKNTKQKSFLKDVIPKMVCTAGFPYDYKSIQNITIAQLIVSMKSVLHEKSFTHLMNGIYSGTVDSSKLTSDEKRWL